MNKFQIEVGCLTIGTEYRYTSILNDFKLRLYRVCGLTALQLYN